MSILQQDYILRMIQMMGELIIAAMKLKEQGALDTAEKSLDAVMHTLMPEQGDIIEMVDVDTAFNLLGDKRLVDAYIGLLLDQAEIKRSLDHHQASMHLEQRAIKLFIVNLRHNLHLSPEAHLIWGRISGLELTRMLDAEDSNYLEEIERLIQKGIIPTA